MGKTAVHGIELMYFYPILNGAYQAPIYNRGSREFSKEETEEATNFYADNQIHKTILGTKTIEGSWLTYQVEQETYTKLLGYKLNSNGSLTDNAERLRFGAGYCVKFNDENGIDRYKLKCQYDMLFGALTGADATDEEAVELKEFEIPFTSQNSSFVTDDEGNFVASMEYIMPVGTTEQDMNDLFMSGLPLPTDVLPTFTQATGTLTAGTPTIDTIGFTYDYTANDEDIANSKITIAEAATPTAIVDEITSLTEGSLTPGSFTGLNENTAYIIKLLQGTREVETLNISTIAVGDLTPPVISVTTDPVSYTTAQDGTITYGDVVTDGGITAIDDVDGDITANLVFNGSFSSTDLVDLSTVGTPSITLDVSDTAGNPAVQTTISLNIT